MDQNKIEKIFDNISSKYDITNSIISIGFEKYWRRRFNSLLTGKDKNILDACCGTGTSSFEIWNMTGRKSTVFGLDVSEEMLRVAEDKYNKKVTINNLKNTGKLIFKKADIVNTGFDDNYFDLVTIIFGIRNISDRIKALKELYRISKNGARFICMEFNYPSQKFIKKIYNLYLDYILVNFGALMTGNRKAYLHLSKSIKKFPQPEKFKELLEKSGWENASFNLYTFGICAIYEAWKK